MKKITCPYCGKTHEVSDEENIIYCQECSKPFNVVQGERLYSMMLVRYLGNGRDELLYTTRYDKSIESYTKVLSMDEKNIEAITGLIVAYLFDSKINDMHFGEIFSLLVKYEEELAYDEKDEFKTEILVDFCGVFYSKLHFFHDTLLDRLADKNKKFYEHKGLEIYKGFLSDYIKILRELANIYKGEKDFFFKLDFSENDLREEVKNLLILGKNEYEVYESNPPFMLESADEKILVKNSIFKDNRKLYKNRNIALIIAAIFLLIFIVGLILTFTMRDKLLIGVPILGVGAVGFAICLLINTILKRKLFKE